MKTLSKVLMAVFAITLFSIQAPSVYAEGGIDGLRGAKAIDDMSVRPEVKGVIEGQKFGRAYRQQPPLIPHRIEKYQVDTKVNQCLSCHAWPYNNEANAPKISETHFTDRDGRPTDGIAARRYFCNQCHVPQVNAKPLVGNTFKNASGQ